MKNFGPILLCIILLPLCTPPRALPEAPRQKVLIGILPEMNVFKQTQRFQRLGRYLSEKTGIAVEFTILSRYGNILHRFSSEKMDGAFFGSFTGALAIRRLGVVPLARPVNPDQTSTYRGYLFVRRDGGIRNAGDMKGARMAFVEKATTAGYLFPLVYLRENGITDTDHFFRESFFSGSHDAAINAVLDGQADVGAAKDTIYDQVRAGDPRVDRELTILAVSARVPSNGLCVRKGLGEDLQRKLKDALLHMHADAEGAAVLKQFGALRFVETTVGDYEPVFRMARKAGIDIKTYWYRND